ncbi:MAG TPA: hypothetical protein VGF39_18470 [Stellaceae bacterium]
MRNSPLNKPDRPVPSGGGWWTAARWLAFVALLGNIMLPAATSIVFSPAGLDRDSLRARICGGWPGDMPGKAKSGLLVQHCPLCSVPAAPLPRPPGFTVPGEIAEQDQFQLRTGVSVASVRHGGMQARAPPLAV